MFSYLTNDNFFPIFGHVAVRCNCVELANVGTHITIVAITAGDSQYDSSHLATHSRLTMDVE